MDLNVLQAVTPALSGLIGAVIGSASSIAASYIQTKRAHKNSELELLNARKREIYDRSISLVADLKLDSDKLFDDLYRASLASLGGSVRVYCDSSFAGCLLNLARWFLMSMAVIAQNVQNSTTNGILCVRYIRMMAC